MKRKTKMEKGITLIALIITIVVLLILATVAISSITNDGILSYATNTAKDYNQAVQKEQEMLEYYEAYLGGTADEWIQNKTTVSKITNKGIITLNVGDYVNYEAGVDGYDDANGWRVLGAENGELLLLSTSYVINNYNLSGKNGYLNCVDNLNAQCKDFGKGNYATGARSINVEDINRITGYNPAFTGDGKPWGSGTLKEYGNEVTYTLNSDGKVEYKSDLISGTSNYTSFVMPDDTVLGHDVESVKIKCNYYHYFPETLTINGTDNNIGLSKTSAAYLMLFKESSDLTINSTYWLASQTRYTYEGTVDFGIRRVTEAQIGARRYWDTTGTTKEDNHGIRAVVSLKSNISLTQESNNSWVISDNS